ncbi:hypothetical protein D3C72_1874910 [compost metagenome]
MGRAREQGQVQRLLEILELQAQRGLGQVQVLGRAREVAFTGNRGKGADVLQVHGFVQRKVSPRCARTCLPPPRSVLPWVGPVARK